MRRFLSVSDELRLRLIYDGEGEPVDEERPGAVGEDEEDLLEEVHVGRDGARDGHGVAVSIVFDGRYDEGGGTVVVVLVQTQFHHQHGLVGSEEHVLPCHVESVRHVGVHLPLLLAPNPHRTVDARGYDDAVRHSQLEGNQSEARAPVRHWRELVER